MGSGAPHEMIVSPLSSTKTSSGPNNRGDQYDFQFDTPLDTPIFGADLDVHGWLVDRRGKPVEGLRAIIKRPFFRQRIIAARRKRTRPDVGLAYPHLPDALRSGFLLELRLGFGRNQILFQVRDPERNWRTFHSARVFAVPLSILARLGLTHLRRFLAFYLKRLAGQRHTPAQSGPISRPGLQSSSLQLRFSVGDGPKSVREKTRVRLFTTSKSNLFIVEIGNLVAAGFREIGCDADLLVDKIPEKEPAPDTLQMVVTPHEFYNLFLRERLSRPELNELTHNLFLLCTEQPETGWFQNNLEWARQARGVADINALGVAAYRRRGISCYHLQLGYHDILAHNPALGHQPRNIDITFLGSMTPRREAFFAEHAEFFSERPCHLRFVPLGFAKTKTTKSYLGVQERNEILSRSRILLNVHYSDQNYFEWHRMLVALANGCCVITETCQGYGALQPGKHFVMVEPEYLIPCCEYYLAHPEECVRIAEQGNAFVRDHLRQNQSCQLYLDEVQRIESETSLVDETGQQPKSIELPVDAASIPLPRALAHQLSRYTTRLFRQAIRNDLREIGAKMSRRSPDPVTRPNHTTSPDANTRAEIILKRKACHERWLKQEAMRSQGNPFLELHDNPAFVACQKPEISVLITLYNYAAFIEECVASVEMAVARLGCACEVLIVNDASTDHSLIRALECQQRLNLPIRVVDKKLNTGLADARNIALELARAPYVFILDADNLIYPNALRQLHDAITKNGYAAAYSVLCRFERTPSNRVGLLSYFDWDPEVLVQFPYVDAMAMFRREVLQEEPGYDHQLSQIGWFGWEDYDMWLRFAQREHRVAFVPNILCLYRYHQSSMINTTMLFQSELVQHFIANYGDLLARFEPREYLFGIERAELSQPQEKVLADAPPSP